MASWRVGVARSLNRLSQTFVAKHTTPGLYGGGNGLYLQIAAGTAEDNPEYVTKRWIFRYAAGAGKEKRERKMGLGPYPLVPLAWRGRWRSSAASSGFAASTR